MTARLLLVALLAVALPSCGEREPVVGVLLPLTSDELAEWGTEAYDGFVLARDEFALGEPPLVQDTGGTVRGTIDAFEALVREGATVVIGPIGTDAAKAAGVVAKRHGVPFVSPSATGGGVVDDNPYAFRTCYDDAAAAAALASFARTHLELRRVAVVVDLDTSYSVGLATAFEEEFVRQRGEVVAEIGYWSDDPDSDTVLDRVAALKDVDGALIAGYGADVARMVRASSHPGLADLVVLGGDGWDHAGLREVLPGAVARAYHTSHFHVDDPRDGVASFVERYVAAYQVPPSDFAALMYDATRAVLTVFDPALDGPAMANRLQSLRDVEGTTGIVTIDPEGDPIDKGIVLERLLPDGTSIFVERSGR